MMQDPNDFTVFTWSPEGIDGHDFAVYAPMVNCRRNPTVAAEKAYLELLEAPIGKRAIRFHAIDEAGYSDGENWYEHDDRTFLEAAIDGPVAEPSVLWMRSFWSRLMQLASVHQKEHEIIDRIILDHEAFFRPYLWGTHFFAGQSRSQRFDELRSSSDGRQVCLDALLAFVSQHKLVLDASELNGSIEMSASTFALKLLRDQRMIELSSSELMNFGNSYGFAMISALNDHYRTIETRLLQSLIAECPVPISVSNYNDRVLPEYATAGFTTRPQSRTGAHLPAVNVGGESSPNTYLFRSAAPDLDGQTHAMWQWTILRINEMMICKNLVPWIGLARYQEQGQFTGDPHITAPIIMAMHALGCQTAILFNPDHPWYDCAAETRMTLEIIDHLRSKATRLRPDQRIPMPLNASEIQLGDERVKQSDLVTMYQLEDGMQIPNRDSVDEALWWDEPVHHEEEVDLAAESAS